MKSKLLNFLLVATSLIGYLEWGGDKHAFVIEAEIDVFSNLFNDPSSVFHPLITLPLAAQLALLINLFLKKPKRVITWLGMGGLAALLGLICVIGIFTLNLKVIVSTLPFLTTAVITLIHTKKQMT